MDIYTTINGSSVRVAEFGQDNATDYAVEFPYGNVEIVGRLDVSNVNTDYLTVSQAYPTLVLNSSASTGLLTSIDSHGRDSGGGTIVASTLDTNMGTCEHGWVRVLPL